jgi:predicted Zn-dependent peptidase
MDKLVSGGVSDDELEKVKNYLKGQFPLSLETPEKIANLLLEVEFYGLPIDYAAKFRQNVDSVTAENVAEIARRYFDTADLAILALGKTVDISPQLQAIGKIETVDMDWKPLGTTK